LDKINWDMLSTNPAIFEFVPKPFIEELMQVCFHPNNLGKFEAWGFE